MTKIVSVKVRPLPTVILLLLAAFLGWMLIRQWLTEAAAPKTNQDSFVNTVPPPSGTVEGKNHWLPPHLGPESKLSNRQKELLKHDNGAAMALNSLLSFDGNGESHYYHLQLIFNNRNRLAFDAYLLSFPELPEALIIYLDSKRDRAVELMRCAINSDDAKFICQLANLPPMLLAQSNGQSIPVLYPILKAIENDNTELFRLMARLPSQGAFAGISQISTTSLPSFADEYMDYIYQSTDSSIEKLANATFENELFRTELLKSDSNSWARGFCRCSDTLRFALLQDIIAAKNKQVATSLFMEGFKDEMVRWTPSSSIDQAVFRDVANELNTIGKNWPGIFEETFPSIKPITKLAKWWEADLQNCTWFDHRERLDKWIPLCRDAIATTERPGLNGHNLQTFIVNTKPWLIAWLVDNDLAVGPKSFPEVDFYRAVKERDRVRIDNLMKVHFDWRNPGRLFAPELFFIIERDEQGLKSVLERKGFELTFDQNWGPMIAIAFRECRDSSGKLERTIPSLLAEHGAIRNGEIFWKLIIDDAESVIELFDTNVPFSDACSKYLPSSIVLAMSRKKPELARKLFSSLMRFEERFRSLDSSANVGPTIDEFLASIQKDQTPTKSADLCTAALDSPELIEDFLQYGLSFTFRDLLFATEKKPVESIAILIRDPSLQRMEPKELAKVLDRAKTRGNQEITDLLNSLK